MFEGYDFSGFWDDSDYSRMKYIDETPDDKLITAVEAELGYKLPESYIWLMKQHNGGVLKKNLFYMNDDETPYVVTGILSLGWKKTYSLCGELGSQFMIDEWEYPPIGVAICDTASAGHEMVFLDYRECGRTGEPEVVWVDQESDYAIVKLADNFEAFIRGLTDEE